MADSSLKEKKVMVVWHELFVATLSWLLWHLYPNAHLHDNMFEAHAQCICQADLSVVFHVIVLLLEDGNNVCSPPVFEHLARKAVL